MSNEEEKFNPICQACGAGCFDWGDIESDPQGYIAEVREQARADALREAAEVCESRAQSENAKHRFTCVMAEARSCKFAILSLIDQPQEDVCKCNADPSHRIGFKFCPYCSKPIKVKE